MFQQHPAPTAPQTVEIKPEGKPAPPLPVKLKGEQVIVDPARPKLTYTRTISAHPNKRVGTTTLRGEVVLVAREDTQGPWSVVRTQGGV